MTEKRARVEGGREGKGRTNCLDTGSPSLSPNPKPCGNGSPQGLSPSGIVSILEGGLESLDLNDFGRPWPAPRRAIIAKLVKEHPYDLCQKAAREAREIVQAQDRAPNITGLFEKKLRELAGVRAEARNSLGAA